jgi:hypothetical protein
VAIPKGKGGAGDIGCFEGYSKFNNQSSAASLHEAIQNAAKRAAKELHLSGSETVEFELSRVQIVVGNPNVKVYRVVISPTG